MRKNLDGAEDSVTESDSEPEIDPRNSVSGFNQPISMLQLWTLVYRNSKLDLAFLSRLGNSMPKLLF
jgi:hypothetical protein